MALGYLEAALLALSLTASIETLLGAGISIVDWDNPIDLSKVEATAFKGRATVDIRFTTADQVTGAYGYIAEADIAATIKDTAGNVVSNATVVEEVG
jgi:hypothetical protein